MLAADREQFHTKVYPTEQSMAGAEAQLRAADFAVIVAKSEVEAERLARTETDTEVVAALKEEPTQRYGVATAFQ